MARVLKTNTGFSDPAPPLLRRPSCPTIASIPATFLHSRHESPRVIPRMPGHDFSREIAEVQVDDALRRGVTRQRDPRREGTSRHR